MEDAEVLTGSYPETLAALGEGRISAKHARVVVDAGALLEPDARAAFDASTALVAAEMTPGDLSRVAKKRAAEAAELSPRVRSARPRPVSVGRVLVPRRRALTSVVRQVRCPRRQPEQMRSRVSSALLGR